MKQLIIAITILFSLALFKNSSAQSNPVNADIVVATDGTGNFTTVQAAIDAAPSNRIK